MNSEPPKAPNHTALSPDALRYRCDPENFGFRTTEDVESVEDLIGQDRAVDAIRFGINMNKPGFNLFLLGTHGSGRHTAIRRMLQKKAKDEAVPDDWVYVANFDVPTKPQAMRLPPGTGIRFRDAMNSLIDDLRTDIPALFEQEEYRNRRRAVDERFEERQGQAFEQLRQKAAAENIAIVRTPMGFALAPVREGQVLKPDEFNALPEDERKRIEETIQRLQKEMETVLQEVPLVEKERRDAVRALNAEFTERAVGASITQVAEQFRGNEAIEEHLRKVREDLIKNANLFIEAVQEDAKQELALFRAPTRGEDPRFRRYMVNVIVGHEGKTDPELKPRGAPVIFEDNPTLYNLVGRIEHTAQFGALTTDFTLIRAGALHRANGGYLVLDAMKVLMYPMSWEALKRSLRSRQVTIISPGEQLGIISTVSLEPDPIPLDVKVVLIGDRLLYYILASADPEFGDLFKVEADFNEEIPRTPENMELYVRLIATIARYRGLRPLTRDAVARVIEEAVRMADDSRKVTVQTGPLADLIMEADYWAGEAGRREITARDVSRAVDAKIRRADRVRELSQESITRDIVLIDTDGAVVGQVNGLAVTSYGQFRFGRPSRITARVRLGGGKVVDIERESELGGKLHSKGVLILSGYLSSHYALDAPPSLSATLVFEQSYGGVEGDSASSAELYALLSALSEVPIGQNFAVTGSVNQMGQVQAIGGVNEKIEGFFDICKARGLTGRQGVLIPQSNVQHLMLREDVVEAVAAGQFHVYPIETIDQGIEVLTGRAAGERGPDGRFPPDTVNALVEAKLESYAALRHRFASKDDDQATPAKDNAT
ncbi:Lon protease family protein [Rhodoligotrophos defluvii]|uniref:Lon protease family protein n=1 Tax=Rhodoligotrophos defluvii TaxID=2561934 RepID=UPI0010C9DE77|nr:ATP-binding protein [Rhodoligotrophos defluvii]